jgi:hypothetical protein
VFGDLVPELIRKAAELSRSTKAQVI